MQLGSGIPAAMSRAEGSLRRRRRGRVRMNPRSSEGMPRLAHPKERAEGPLWRGESDGRRRKRSGRRAEVDRHDRRPNGRGARRELKDTAVKFAENLARQGAMRINARILRRDPKTDVASDDRRRARGIRRELPLSMDLPTARRDAIQIEEQHRLRGLTKTRWDNQARLLAHPTDSDGVGLARGIRQMDGRIERTISDPQRASRGDAVLRRDRPGRRPRGVHTIG